MAAQESETEPPSAMLTATCRTTGCPEEGVPNVRQFYANAEPPVYRAVCMGCEQPITDLVPYVAPGA